MSLPIADLPGGGNITRVIFTVFNKINVLRRC